MRTTIDAAGRVVIPRQLRERAGMYGAGEVEIELIGGAIRIEPVLSDDLVERDGLLVIPATGQPVLAATIRDLIDDERHRS